MIRRLAISASLLALTLSAPAKALDLTAMSEAERAAFRAEIRAYLLENPEVIYEAVAVLEKRNAEAAANADLQLVADNRDALFNDGYSWVGGNPEGDLTLVEFVDYRCGYCRRAAPEVEKLLKADGNIRLIRKELPILGNDSVQSARFAIAVKQLAGDAAYEAAHGALIEMKAPATPATLRRLSEELALDVDTDALLEHMNSDQVSAEIDQTAELARALRISGTPSFVMESEMLRGYLPADQMAEIAAELRAR